LLTNTKYVAITVNISKVRIKDYQHSAITSIDLNYKCYRHLKTDFKTKFQIK